MSKYLPVYVLVTSSPPDNLRSSASDRLLPAIPLRTSLNALRRFVRHAMQHTTVRFVLVGISNTLIDVFCFNLLLFLGKAPLVLASIISTTIAMAFSYLLNKQAVFRNKTPHSLAQVALFLGVTLAGIWLVQTIIMVGCFRMLERVLPATGHPAAVWVVQNIAKGIGIIAGALWNYVGYSRLVFRSSAKKLTRA